MACAIFGPAIDNVAAPTPLPSSLSDISDAPYPTAAATRLPVTSGLVPKPRPAKRSLLWPAVNWRPRDNRPTGASDVNLSYVPVGFRAGISIDCTTGHGRGCVKTRNAIRVRSILFVFQKKTSQNCTWVHQKRIVEALKTSQRGFLHSLGQNQSIRRPKWSPGSRRSLSDIRWGLRWLPISYRGYLV